MQTDDISLPHGMTDLPENLRLLCSYYRSVSEVCRKLNINRSQFNRYLSGASIPSTYILRQLCNFFGVEHYEMFIPHAEFKALLSDKPHLGDNQNETLSTVHKHMKKLQDATSPDVNRYLGFYFEHYYSMTYPDKILRSLMHVTREGNQVVYQRFESLGEPGNQQTTIKCRYEGVLYFLQDRIFLVDYETLTMNEMTQTVLYPSFYSKVDFLIGIKLGVSAVRDRKPLVRNVVLQSLGAEVNLRECVRKTGLYRADHESLNPFILDRLQEPVATN